MNNTKDNTIEQLKKNSVHPKKKKRSGPPRKQRRNKKVAPLPSISSISSTSSSSSSVSISASETAFNRSKHQSRKKKKQKYTKKNSVQSYDCNSRYVALDCEMVGVGPNGQKSALARVTIIDWYGKVLLDEYVKPDSDITDYRTFVSGITKEDLEQHATLSLAQCRRLVVDILRHKILIGHALDNDLQVLGIDHPWYQIRDTAKYEPFMKMRFNDGVLWPRKLKELSRERLQREMQAVGKPHSPYEDALAALDLYKLVQTSWEKAMEYQKLMAIKAERQRQYQQSLLQKQFYATTRRSHNYQPLNGGFGAPAIYVQVPGTISGSGEYTQSTQPKFVTTR